MSLLTEFANRFIAGLQRQAVSTPSRWVQEYIKNPDGTPFTFKRYPWQKEMLESQASHNIACKGAQMGVSHLVLCRGVCANDMEKRDVLYVLPSMHPHGSDFSSARFDKLVAASPHLAKLYDKSNVGHKSTATNNFYIRGAQSRTGGKSVPAGFLVIDEIDEVPRDFIPLVRERMSGQDVKTEWDISTPTIPEFGISRLWDESTQEHFFFPCPSCTLSANGPTSPRLIHLTYPECLEIIGDDPDSTEMLTQSFLKCPNCGIKLEHKSKPDLFKLARFVPTVSGKEKRGFHISQLYSMTVTPGEIASAATRAAFSEVDAQEFWNSKMGKAFAPEGSKITEAMVHACRAQYHNGTNRAASIVTMGVDVGRRLHFEIDGWTMGANYGNDISSSSVPKVLKCGFVQNFEDLDALMIEYQVNMCVIDALPETRKAFEFSQRFWGFVKMCYYAQGVTGRMLMETKWDQGEPIINVNRTSWLDLSMERFKKQRIQLPLDTPFEYVEHLKQPVRIQVRHKDGNLVAAWKTPESKADHHAHSRVYAEIAFPLALNHGQSYDGESPLD